MAKPCLAVPLRRVRRYALPFPCAVLHFKSAADQIADEHRLRPAMLRKATPSLPVSVHRRRMPRLCFAVALHSTALRRGAVAVRGPSWPSYPMPLRIGPLPILRGAVRCAAPPSPIASPRCYAAAAQRHSKPSHAAHGVALPSPRSTSQCLSFADLGSAVHFHRLAEQIKALPLHIPATHFLRSPPLSRASPSRGCASPCFSLPSPLCSMRSSSVAALSKPTRFRCQAFRRISVAEPLHAVLLLRDAGPGKSFAIRSCAVHPSRFLCYASPRDSAARPCLASLSHRDAVHPLAVPSHSTATLRKAVATPARSRRSTRSGPCRCCATGRCRGTGRSRATPARAASPTCS